MRLLKYFNPNAPETVELVLTQHNHVSGILATGWSYRREYTRTTQTAGQGGGIGQLLPALVVCWGRAHASVLFDTDRPFLLAARCYTLLLGERERTLKASRCGERGPTTGGSVRAKRLYTHASDSTSGADCHTHQSPDQHRLEKHNEAKLTSHCIPGNVCYLKVLAERGMYAAFSLKTDAPSTRPNHYK